MSVFLREVKTENGWVRGVPAADPRITAFKGVPFAKPPVGELRWRAPQSADNWVGVRECKEFAPISMQTPPGLNPDIVYTKEWNVDPEIPMSEDCLYLNIWTPAKTGKEKFPVFVWYFGGGLKEGNTAEMEFDGERIARRGIVVVSINYRVNSFGFLCHPEITAENPDAPANFGHLDQQFGTRWVKRNIEAFGGDPDNITIGGQSAGGMSVSTQLCCPENEGLFQKAIVMSGIMINNYASFFRFNRTLQEGEEEGKKFFEFLGVKTLAEARALDAMYIRDKTTEYNHMFGTVVDGKFQKGVYVEQMRTGDRLDVPVMVGWTNNEFLARPASQDADSLTEELRRCFKPESAEKLMAMTRPGEDFEGAKTRLSFVGPEGGSRTFLRGDEKSGKIRSARYAYEFGPTMPGDDSGAFHSSDLWFFFETLAKCWRPFDGHHYDLARKMCNYWCNFFRTGDPNGPDADGTPMPEWKPYTEERPTVARFHDQVTVDAEPCSPVLDICIDSFL
ncbi:MAG: carboxylesterase family protein [Firmicutes bacterium]|nr:carboxylesterase family protein [Bacillota bacterium]